MVPNNGKPSHKTPNTGAHGNKPCGLFVITVEDLLQP